MKEMIQERRESDNMYCVFLWSSDAFNGRVLLPGSAGWSRLEWDRGQGLKKKANINCWPVIGSEPWCPTLKCMCFTTSTSVPPSSPHKGRPLSLARRIGFEICEVRNHPAWTSVAWFTGLTRDGGKSWMCGRYSTLIVCSPLFLLNPSLFI